VVRKAVAVSGGMDPCFAPGPQCVESARYMGKHETFQQEPKNEPVALWPGLCGDGISGGDDVGRDGVG
jgi:hypothetical protein